MHRENKISYFQWCKIILFHFFEILCSIKPQTERKKLISISPTAFSPHCIFFLNLLKGGVIEQKLEGIFRCIRVREYTKMNEM